MLNDRKIKLQIIENKLFQGRDENVKFNLDKAKAESEAKIAKEDLNRLENLVEKYKVPSVMDFANTEQTLQNMKKTIKHMVRERKIASYKIKRALSTKM